MNASLSVMSFLRTEYAYEYPSYSSLVAFDSAIIITLVAIAVALAYIRVILFSAYCLISSVSLTTNVMFCYICHFLYDYNSMSLSSTADSKSASSSIFLS
jgi:hypothetical protein